MAFSALVGHELMHSGGRFLRPITRTAEYVANWATANEMPPAERLMDLFVHGWISATTADEVLLLHGISTNLDGAHVATVDVEAGNKRRALWNQVVYSQQELPTVGELGVLRNRGLLDDARYDQSLRRKGFVSLGVREEVGNLRFELPGPSDLVRFAVRHVFEPELVKYLTYPAERDRGPFLLDIFHQASGINYPIFSGPLAPTVQMVTGKPPEEFVRLYADAGLPEPTWADAYWWSHWVLPSATQGYEMLFRLRPDRDRRFDPPFAREENFSKADLDLLLRANDYPVFYRDKLAAIAYRIPGIRFLRQLRATEVFDRAAVQELLLRQGYSPGDAAVLAESVERNEVSARRRQIEQQAKGQLAKYWELGIIDQGQYIDLLVEHGMTQDDAVQAATLGNLDLTFKRVEGIVRFTRGQFTKGALSDVEAADHLRQAGIVEPRVSQYIQDWQLELAEKHREISAEKAVQWACKGLISAEQLRNRLVNLGYRESDVNGLVAEAAICQANLAARAAARADRDARQTQRALQQQQRNAARAIVEARRQLARHGTPAQLRKWFCQGHVGEGEVYSRLRFLGWPDIDITRLIGDCQSGKSTGRGGQRGGATIGGGGAPGGAPPAGGPPG